MPLLAEPITDSEAILATLEQVAERHGDPTQAIYATLFARHPELEALFWLDRDGGVRQAMVQQALDCVLDHVGERLTSHQIIAAARQHHDGYSVPPEQFDVLFVAMRDVFRDSLGADWTGPMDDAWTRLLQTFAAIR